MIFSYLLNMQSHPSWVCGLKLPYVSLQALQTKSHPSWVCGLKHYAVSTDYVEDCHTLRGCVD